MGCRAFPVSILQKGTLRPGAAPPPGELITERVLPGGWRGLLTPAAAPGFSWATNRVPVTKAAASPYGASVGFRGRPPSRWGAGCIPAPLPLIQWLLLGSTTPVITPVTTAATF